MKKYEIQYEAKEGTLTIIYEGDPIFQVGWLTIHGLPDDLGRCPLVVGLPSESIYYIREII